ncbi:MAG: pyridoxine 5'-phosphate synthase [candidate division WOR-3 bacterium]|nr:pyridoxine 5'-phosphate synthase [candidate division WOR-3 bacterium]
MRKLSVNIDHIATLRQARRESFPDPVQSAVLCELGGADGITVHLRQDRRHINDRDLELLRKTIKTELNLEMAPSTEMLNIALKVKPDTITLVPERAEEITTEGGLDIVHHRDKIKPIAQKIVRAGISLSFFIEAEIEQVKTAIALNADQIEINTNQYAKDKLNREKILTKIAEIAKLSKSHNINVHCGHSIDYQNIYPLLEIKEITGFSIGFAIIARAVMVGLKEAVSEMKSIITRF